MALVFAGGYAVAAHKTVTLTIDGAPMTVSTMKSRVIDVVKENGFDVGERDTLYPAPDQPVHQSDNIVLRRSRPLQISLDGHGSREVWTTASTVQEALTQLSLTDTAPAAASRATRVPLGGMSLPVVTPRTVSLNDGGVIRPQDHVFTGFDQVLDYGKILGLQMSKVSWFDAASFIQVSLKSQWQDAVLRRGAVDAQGNLIVPPRFGQHIGYCPTFLMADECQTSATPRDNEFKALCRSKRASCWELTQSHNSILEAFAPGKEKAAETYFQNSMTHLYLRQADLHSMEIIQKEAGTKDIAKTQLAVTEGGRASDLSYIQGGFVNKGLAMSSTRTVTAEEKPFVEIDELRQLPNNVAVAFPSTGEKTLPATYLFLRPLWVFQGRPSLTLETPWLDWPDELRKSYDLDTIPQECLWAGWGINPLAPSEVFTQDQHLAAFLQAHPGVESPPA